MNATIENLMIKYPNKTEFSAAMIKDAADAAGDHRLSR